MNFRFPLPDVHIALSTEKKQVENPLYEDEYYKLNQYEFSMNIENAGWFYASGGNKVELVLNEGVSQSTLELYLNGSTYGAILHQRGILPMHGSCFAFQGKGIMLCGESGAGKSSLTTAFVLDGNEFLTDDVTPIIFSEGKPQIWAMSDRVKLWGDSLEQLKQIQKGLDPIDPETEKFYFPLPSSKADSFPLDHIFLLEVQENEEVCFQDLKGAEKLTGLRNEIYRLEYLLGMPENEAKFFPQLAAISKKVCMTSLIRPRNSLISETKAKLTEYLQSQ